MKKKLRLGILGLGNMGTAHTHMLRLVPKIKLTAVADINPDRLAWAEKHLKNVARFDSAEKMMDSGLIDAILVAVPHYDHPKYVIAAFEKGLHVMCEKPAGVYTKQVMEMNAAADKANVVFGMMFNQRTNPIYRKMRDLVQGGSLGEIKRTNWIITNWYRSQAYYDSGAWRATWSGEGGGVLLNQCPHNLDLWQWICGMPVSIQAHLHFGKWRDIEVEDDVTAYAEYKNGATGVFITTTADAPGTNRFEVTLDKGKLVAENGKLTLWKLNKSEQEFSRENKASFGSPKVKKRRIRVSRISKQHVGVMQAFANAVLEGKPLVADGREGINGLMISNAMHLSTWLDKKVNLPVDENIYYEELMKRVATSRRKETVNTINVNTKGSYGGF